MVTRAFLALGVFAAGAAAVYWFVTGESVGTVLLLTFAAMPTIVGAYAIRHGGLRSEDGSETDPGSRAGEVLGPFPAESVWPILLGLGTIAVGACLIYGLILSPLAVGLFLWAIVGFARESHG